MRTSTNVDLHIAGIDERPLVLKGKIWRSSKFPIYGSREFFLPKNTLVYGEFVDHASSEKWPLTVFHIIDAAIVGGIDVSREGFAAR
jgi:hypothetical protein